MDSRQDDSAPAGSRDAGGTLYRATHDDSRSEIDRAAAADPTAAARETTSILYRVPTDTARLRQDLVFCVGARIGKIKREELENASTAANVLRFIRTFEQYIEEIRPDSKKEEVIELLREFFSDTMNFVHRKVPQISALHVFREVLFADEAIEKPVLCVAKDENAVDIICRRLSCNFLRESRI
jgi:hypothetical protein